MFDYYDICHVECTRKLSLSINILYNNRGIPIFIKEITHIYEAWVLLASSRQKYVFEGNLINRK